MNRGRQCGSRKPLFVSWKSERFSEATKLFVDDSASEGRGGGGDGMVVKSTN